MKLSSILFFASFAAGGLTQIVDKDNPYANFVMSRSHDKYGSKYIPNLVSSSTE